MHGTRAFCISSHRYDPHTGDITLTCRMYNEREDNRKRCFQMLENLILEGQSKYSNEGFLFERTSSQPLLAEAGALKSVIAPVAWTHCSAKQFLSFGFVFFLIQFVWISEDIRFFGAPVQFFLCFSSLFLYLASWIIHKNCWSLIQNREGDRLLYARMLFCRRRWTFPSWGRCKSMVHPVVHSGTPQGWA